MPRSPRVTRRGGGGGSAAGVRYLVAGAQAWHAQAEACAGQKSSVSTGLRMPMMASGHASRCEQRGPGRPQGECRIGGYAPAVPPPPPLTSAAMDASFAEAVVEQSSPGLRWPKFRSRWGGGGGRSSPFNFGTTCPF